MDYSIRKLKELDSTYITELTFVSHRSVYCWEDWMGTIIEGI